MKQIGDGSVLGKRVGQIPRQIRTPQFALPTTNFLRVCIFSGYSDILATQRRLIQLKAALRERIRKSRQTNRL